MATNVFEANRASATNTTLPNPNTSGPSIREEQSLGLRSIYNACRCLYPDQPTPLQVTAVRKYWMGGPDPLDFINMYDNPGSTDLRSPTHWHYITNGLSDLYGDSRLHSYSNSSDGPSGFGFELTLRIQRNPEETNPPTWPAHLLQSLARYVFNSQAQLMAGDHIPWPTALDKQPQQGSSSSKPTDCCKSSFAPNNDRSSQSIAICAAATAASLIAANGAKSGDASVSTLMNPSTYASIVAAAMAAIKTTTNADTDCRMSVNTPRLESISKSSSSESVSRIHHMLLVEDPQLRTISTPYGYVQFLQLVGLCDEELRLVQRWTGAHVAELMCCFPETGGGLLVTDMRRKRSIFELEPSLVEVVNEQLKRDGSNLSGVTTQYFAWSPITLASMGELLPDESTSHAQLHSVHGYKSSFPSFQLSVSKPNPPVLNSTKTFSEMDHCKSTTSVDPVAMETDDQHSSQVIKKNYDDDEFVDVVGDGSSSTTTNTTVEMSAQVSKDHQQDLSDPQNDSNMPREGSGDEQIDGNVLDRVTESQSASAPSRFSAWCDRLEAKQREVQRSLSGTYHSNIVPPCDVDGSLSTIACTSTLHKTPSNSHTPSELTHPITGPLGFKSFNSNFPPLLGSGGCSSSLVPLKSTLDQKSGIRTPGSAGESSAPCTPLAHLSLSPASLDMLPTRIIDCLDVHLCLEAGEMLPLAVSDRLRHGRHFTFLNANHPDYAITLVPDGVSGAFVSEDTPYVSRGPWLQIFLPQEFLNNLEYQLSSLRRLDQSHLPLVFRWPERNLRICIINPARKCHQGTTYHSHLPSKTFTLNSPEPMSAPSATFQRKPTRHSSLSGYNSRTVPCSDVTPDHMQSTSNLFPLLSPGHVPHPGLLSAMFNDYSDPNFQAALSTMFPIDPRQSQISSNNSRSDLPSATHTSNQPNIVEHHRNEPDRAQQYQRPNPDLLAASWYNFFKGFMTDNTTTHNNTHLSGLPPVSPEAMQAAFAATQQQYSALNPTPMNNWPSMAAFMMSMDNSRTQSRIPQTTAQPTSIGKTGRS